MSSLSKAIWEDVPGQALGQGVKALLGPQGHVGRLLIRGKDGAPGDPGTPPPQHCTENHRPSPPAARGF